MATFIKLEDSPMFQKQIRSLEQTAQELNERCQRLCNGSKRYMESLGQACNEETIFAESLETFGGDQDDPVSLSLGGPIISKFVMIFRELATHKELLRSQVEHVLVDRLTQFMSVDLHDVKDSRRRFDKAIHSYDQAREKFASLKKSTRQEIVAELEEDLHNSKSSFEKSRFNLVNSLMSIETRKKYEFLESFSAIMDAHLRHFKLGYDLLRQLEPFIHQVLTYAQQSKEQANVEQDKLARRIQEFRTQTELSQLRASSSLGASTGIVAANGFGMSSCKDIEEIMRSTAKGEVQTIKQGYLLKRSSSLRADWKRRFFVLDSHGTLYYHRHKGTRPVGSHLFHSANSVEYNIRVFSRFQSRHHRGSSSDEETVDYCTVDLRTSTIKIDAEDTDLWLCFRIISPLKTYTLQAENEADRIDWMNKIKGVIASLLNSRLQQLQPGKSEVEEKIAISGVSSDQYSSSLESSLADMKVDQVDCVSNILRGIPGNDFCAECRAPEPEWASLNLGVLICIECSGIHRNLGVHISKVRSIILDVKVWEPTILDLFRSLGNAYCNSIWEELLLQSERMNEPNSFLPVVRPSPKDAIHLKEKYVQAKYVEKLLISKVAASSGSPHLAVVWEAVKTNKLQEVYRLIVTSDINIINTTYDEAVGGQLCHNEHQSMEGTSAADKNKYDPAACHKTSSSKSDTCLQGCSLLHLACRYGNAVMVELLLQFGADINRCDFHGRTPLHHCISQGDNTLAKLLLRRGARSSVKDGGGLGALERAMEMGAITDDQLFVLLTECQ